MVSWVAVCRTDCESYPVLQSCSVLSRRLVALSSLGTLRAWRRGWAPWPGASGWAGWIAVVRVSGVARPGCLLFAWILCITSTYPIQFMHAFRRRDWSAWTMECNCSLCFGGCGVARWRRIHDVKWRSSYSNYYSNQSFPCTLNCESGHYCWQNCTILRWCFGGCFVVGHNYRIFILVYILLIQN